MSKGLKALEKIDHTVCLAFNENNNALFNKDEYEHIDCKDINEFVDCYDIIEKELKALEIIKEKKVDVLALFLGNYSLKKYNNMHEDLGNISQEEFDLLKEVLL